jgi:hypothetical protein
MTSPIAKGARQWNAESGCAGKVRFETHQLAAQVNTDRKKSRGNVRRGIYRCPACNGFHIGRRNRISKQSKLDPRRVIELARQQEDETRELQQQNAGL